MDTDITDTIPHMATVVSARKVVFVFDLNIEENHVLRDRKNLDAGMALFLLKYSKFEYYTAEYVGDWLTVSAHGNVNLR